jgi:prepilin-type processing-associated H-X9-DG protein
MHTIDNAYVLFDEFEDFEQDQGRTRTRINRNLSFVDQAGMRVVFQWQEPLFRFSLSDALSLRYAAVQLRMGNLATQEELAQAFQHSVATQRRWETRFQSHGLEGLKRGKSTGRPAAIPRTLDGVLRKWFEEGVPNCEMAKRLQVSEATIHRALSRLGMQRQTATTELPWPTDSEEELQRTDGKESQEALPAEAAEANEHELSAAEAKPLESGQGAEQQNAENESVETTEPVSKEVVPETADARQSDSCGLIQQESEASDGGKPTDAAAVVKAPAADDGAAAEACLQGQPVFGELLEDVLAELEEQGFTIDRDADDRCGDRTLARLGRLDDATPLFADRPGVRQAGVLLTIPLLVRSRLLDVFLGVYHSLGPAFYGLRTTVLVLFVAALLRIKRPEHFKEHNPRELGHLLGLDRAPEVKTVRRKLAELAARRRALEVMMAMAKQRLREDPERGAFLYVDGHVRIYHGKYALAKTKKSQHQVAKPAATDPQELKVTPYFRVTQERRGKADFFSARWCVRQKLASGGVFWPPSAQSFFAAGWTGFKFEPSPNPRDGLRSRGDAGLPPNARDSGLRSRPRPGPCTVGPL